MHSIEVCSHFFIGYQLFRLERPIFRIRDKTQHYHTVTHWGTLAMEGHFSFGTLLQIERLEHSHVHIWCGFSFERQSRLLLTIKTHVRARLNGLIGHPVRTFPRNTILWNVQ